MLKNVVALAVLVLLLAAGVKYWSPESPPITGVTPDDVAVQIADRVESTYDSVIVTSVVTKPSESSNDAVVQYVLVMNTDPDLFGIQPQTQQEADAQAKAYGDLQGAIADILSLTSQYLTSVNPTVVQVRLTMIFLDGQVYDGSTSASDLNAIPQGSTQQEWMSVIPLTPVVMIPQSVWEAITADPVVQKLLEQALNQQQG